MSKARIRCTLSGFCPSYGLRYLGGFSGKDAVAKATLAAETCDTPNLWVTVERTATAPASIIPLRGANPFGA